MKKLVIALVLAMSLGACAQLQKLENIYGEVSGATIKPSVLYLAVNAFDGLKASVPQYAAYCRPFVNIRSHRAVANAPAGCSDDNRRTVIAAMKSATGARNQAETYLTNNQPAPRVIFDTIKAAVDALQPITITGVVQ